MHNVTFRIKDQEHRIKFLDHDLVWLTYTNHTESSAMAMFISKQFLFQLDTFIRNNMVDHRTVLDTIEEDFGLKMDPDLKDQVRKAIRQWVYDKHTKEEEL